MFSKDLAWGYFDHPPFVAALIRLSDLLFNGILSIRFFTIICHGITVFLVFETIDFSTELKSQRERINVFMCFLFLLPLAHVFSFVTTPDSSLLLSVALFYFFYKKTLNKSEVSNFILLGISMALLLYAKYHGVLVIFFTLLSNIKALKDPKYYLSGIITLLLFSPHIFWQAENDFVSISYHLSERITSFHWSFPLEYLFNVLIVFNPFLWFFIYRLSREKLFTKFQKALYFTIVGFILFFLYQSFKVRVQPQWLIACYIPLIILLLEKWKLNYSKKLKWALLLSLPFFIALRLVMMFDIVERDLGFHRFEEYTNMIFDDAKGKEVMFKNSYRRASLYTWYQDQDYTHSFNSSSGRKNQFSLWEKDSLFFDKEVFFVGMYKPGNDPVYYEEPEFYGNTIIYKPSDKVRFLLKELTFNGIDLKMNAKVINPYGIALDYKENYQLGLKIFYADRSEIIEISSFNQILQPHSSKDIDINFSLPNQGNILFIGLTSKHKSLPFGPVFNKLKVNK